MTANEEEAAAASEEEEEGRGLEFAPKNARRRRGRGGMDGSRTDGRSIDPTRL